MSNLYFIYSVNGVISFESINDKTLFPDLPPGPFDRYRNNAKFDWRKLALTLDDERCLRFRVWILLIFFVFSLSVFTKELYFHLKKKQIRIQYGATWRIIIYLLEAMKNKHSINIVN